MSTLDSSSLNHGAEVPGAAEPAGLEGAALERQEMPAASEPADSAGLAGEAVQPAAECAMADVPDEQPAADPTASDNLQPSVGEPPAEGAEPVAESTPSVAVLDNYVAPAVSAAKAAADFVAQIFAEVRASDVPEGAAGPVVNDLPVVEAQPAELEPQARPGEGMAPMQGQNVLVLGLGASGLAMARWCVRRGAQVTVADTREAPPQLALLQQELPQVRFVAGPFDASLVDGKGLHAVYRSPGLSPATFAPVFQAAQAIGLVTGSELTLYAASLAPMAKPRSHRSPGNWWSVLAKPWQWLAILAPHCSTPWQVISTRIHCPRPGCWSFPAFSSMAWLALNPRPPRC